MNVNRCRHIYTYIYVEINIWYIYIYICKRITKYRYVYMSIYIKVYSKNFILNASHPPGHLPTPQTLYTGVDVCTESLTVWAVCLSSSSDFRVTSHPLAASAPMTQTARELEAKVSEDTSIHLHFPTADTAGTKVSSSRVHLHSLTIWFKLYTIRIGTASTLTRKKHVV